MKATPFLVSGRMLLMEVVRAHYPFAGEGNPMRWEYTYTVYIAPPLDYKSYE